MALDLGEDYAWKHSIANELFIATADENYVTARWCYQSDLRVDFFWLALHCLEKYLKAALLLNGLSAKDYNHDLVKLLRARTTPRAGVASCHALKAVAV